MMNSFPILMAVIDAIIWFYITLFSLGAIVYVFGLILGSPILLFKDRKKGAEVISKIFVYLLIGGMIYWAVIEFVDMFNRGDPSEIWISVIGTILVLLYFGFFNKDFRNLFKGKKKS